MKFSSHLSVSLPSQARKSIYTWAMQAHFSIQRGRLSDFMFAAGFIISPTDMLLKNNHFYPPSDCSHTYSFYSKTKMSVASSLQNVSQQTTQNINILYRIKSREKKRNLLQKTLSGPGSHIWWRIWTILLELKSLSFPPTCVWMSLRYVTCILFSCGYIYCQKNCCAHLRADWGLTPHCHVCFFRKFGGSDDITFLHPLQLCIF